MKTTKPITPAEAGLSLIIASGPRGTVKDNDWPCIEYTVQLMHRHKPIYTGEYRLGVGHVKPGATKIPHYGNPTPVQQMIWSWQSNPHAQFTDKQLWADAAAFLAKTQKVTPKLEDVTHSLLSDGSAFFDGLKFEDWAPEFGYDSDSIKAKGIFEACDRIGRDLSRALSRDELEGLREWASNY